MITKSIKEEIMKQFSMVLKAALAVVLVSGGVAKAEELRLSHQWSTKDVRHKVAQIVADEVAAAASVPATVLCWTTRPIHGNRNSRSCRASNTSR
jgi:outer membrane murein-binding lipoprotein Lpp